LLVSNEVNYPFVLKNCLRSQGQLQDKLCCPDPWPLPRRLWLRVHRKVATIDLCCQNRCSLLLFTLINRWLHVNSLLYSVTHPLTQL